MKKITRFFGSKAGIILTGAFIGILAAMLQKWGNPRNMGICVACFERDIAGALGLHRADTVQYIRPEIIGMVLGALLSALIFAEFKPRTGSAPIVRFFLGIFAMIGALVFLGCPWRMFLRLAGGDLNALLGAAGLALGIFIGAQFLKSGYSLGRNRPMNAAGGLVMPGFMLMLLFFLIFKATFSKDGPIFFSSKGPGSIHAALWVSILAGLGIGFVAQRSRFCTMGAFRDIFIIGDFHLMFGILALLISAFAVNLIIFKMDPVTKAGFASMPISHSNHLWNFLGMILAGLAFTLAGGCPGRQLFLAGEGDGDAGIFVLGMIIGAGFAHNFALAGKPDAVVDGALKIGGTSAFGMWSVGIGILFCLLIGFTMREKAAV